MLPARGEPVILIAQSARALAEASRAAGRIPWVIDRFLDDDTRLAAARMCAVPANAAGGLHAAKVCAQVAAWRREAGPVPVLWGGGLEGQPALMRRLASHGPVLGSDPQALFRLRHPHQLCHALGVRMPETRRRAPRHGRWLSKRADAAGGWHVRPATAGARAARGHCLERRLAGRVCSLVFLAVGDAVLPVGWNALLEAGGEVDFRYHGAEACELSAPVCAVVLEAAHTLACALRWRGLCGLDFIVDDTECAWIIDLNPRPTATVELHLAPPAAFEAHLAACGGHLMPFTRMDGRRAHRVLYAPDPIQIPEGLDWPPWASDRPAGGSIVTRGAPLCSVRAETDGSGSLLAMLHGRAQEIFERLGIRAAVPAVNHAGSGHVD